MKYLKRFESKILNYKEGDYVVPIEVENGKNPKDSYTVIDDVRGGSFGDYMVSTYNIYTGQRLEGPWPILDSEILRKLTQEEIDYFDILRSTKNYNL